MHIKFSLTPYKTLERILQTVVFRIIFVTDGLKNLQNLKCGILELLILNPIESKHLPITSLLYKP